MSLTLEQRDALSRVHFTGELIVLRTNDSEKEKEVLAKQLEERIASARALGCSEESILRMLPMSMTCA